MYEVIYRRLLRLYPAAFRNEYGHEALLLFRDRLVNERSAFRRLRLMWDVAIDLLVSIPREHRRPPQTMLAEGPAFHILSDEGPSRGSLIAGVVISLLALHFVHAAMLSGPFRPVRGRSFFGGAFSLMRIQSKPAFEVASIKPNTSAGPTLIAPPTDVRLFVSNATLRTLIRVAFRFEDDSRILGGPEWMNAYRFDVEGRAGRPVGTDQMMLMLQSLLEERFQLRVHRETRIGPAYFLVVGKDGHKMEQLKDENGKPILVLTPPPGAPPPPPPPPPAPPGSQFGGPLRMMNSWGLSMEQLAVRLTPAAGRPVIDKTGLTGFFAFKLEWAPDPVVAGDTPPAVSPGPSIFTAVQEQLGLRLEPRQKEPVEFLVIDGVERPSEN
jgi:uncharacterized protein (TIGR03435 family)